MTLWLPQEGVAESATPRAAAEVKTLWLLLANVAKTATPTAAPL
jgi:hypothetical protein